MIEKNIVSSNLFCLAVYFIAACQNNMSNIEPKNGSS